MINQNAESNFFITFINNTKKPIGEYNAGEMGRSRGIKTFTS